MEFGDYLPFLSDQSLSPFLLRKHMIKYCECGCVNRVCLTEETKEKISNALIGRKLSDEHKRKLKEVWKGRKHSEESKRRMSIAHKGKKGTNLGRKFSEEAKRKMGIGQIGRKHSEETKRKMSLIRKEGYATGRIKIHKRYFNTSIELTIKNELEKKNIKYEKQKYLKNVGFVDFFLSDSNIIIECDGNYFHNLEGAQQKDSNRDLRASFNGYKTVRLWEYEINESPKKCIEKIIAALGKETNYENKV